MILLRMLDHDLHRARNPDAVPMMLETPASKEFLPAVVSSSRGGFLVTRKLFQNARVRSGVFEYDSEKLDDLIGPMVSACLALSESEDWPNRFPQSSSGASAAFDYVRSSSGLLTEPRMCLVPAAWSQTRVSTFLGKASLKNGKFRETCFVLPANTDFPVFSSRPDMVGLFTQFLGGKSSLVVHNVRRGLAFCVATR